MGCDSGWAILDFGFGESEQAANNCSKKVATQPKPDRQREKGDYEAMVYLQ